MKPQIIIAFFLTILGFVNVALAVCTAPPANMVGWWAGDGDATDLVNGNDGTPQDTVNYVSGKVDQAFSIASPTAYVLVPKSTELEPAAVTVDAWVKASAPGTFKYIAAKGAQACQAASYALYTGGTGGLFFYIWNGNDFYLSPDAGSEIWDGEWHHVAGTYDGSAVRLFVDGDEVGSTSASTSIQYGLSTSNDFIIGSYLNTACQSNSYSFENGDIDEVEVFDRALSQPAIEAIYEADSDGKCKTITVAIDVKPGSDPNCFNINGHGVIPVAILGADDFDVTQIDVTTLSFGGLEVRVRGNKGPLCSVEYSNGDEHLDLVCHFEDDSGSWTAGTSEASLTGNLIQEFGATPIEGTDSICVVP